MIISYYEGFGKGRSPLSPANLRPVFIRRIPTQSGINPYLDERGSFDTKRSLRT